MFKILFTLLALNFSAMAANKGYDPVKAFSQDPKVIEALGGAEIGQPRAIRILSGNAGGGPIEGYVVGQSIKDGEKSTKSVIASVTLTPAKTAVALIRVVPLEAGRKAGAEKNPVVAFEKDKVVIERVGKSKSDPAEAVLLDSSSSDNGVYESHLVSKVIHRPAGNPAPSSSILGLITITPVDTNVQIVKLVFK